MTPQATQGTPSRQLPPGVVPYGGDTVTARSLLPAHARSWWDGRCACGDPYPCHTRVMCLITLAETEPEHGPAGRTVFAWAVLAIFGGALVAAIARWMPGWWWTP